MKYICCFFVLLLPALQPRVLAQTATTGFRIQVQAPGYTRGIAYLAYHSGKNLNVEDSAAMTPQATALFTGKRRLPAGIYAIVLPGKRQMIDLFVDKEQVISVKMDTTDLLNKTVVTGSKAHLLFQDYQKFMAAKGPEWDRARQAYSAAKTREDSLRYEARYTQLNQELSTYREQIMNNQPNSMLAIILRAMKEPQVPIAQPVTRNDSLENYYYYRTHFWDGVTFMDEHVLRSPFFIPRFEKYYRELLIQHPDSIIKALDYQLLLARSCPEMYKFMLNWLTDEYINPKYMGQDAVFVHLFEKYHSKGLTKWLNEKQMETISRRAYMLMANLIGNPAPNLDMLSANGQPAPLYGLEADFVVVCFWDPNCGHCKEEVPRLDSIYKASWKSHGVKMYGVLSGDAKNDVLPAWKTFIEEKGLQEWTHVYQTTEMEEAEKKAQKPSYRQLYDVTMTPTIFLLDKEKRIIGKKLTWQQLDDLLKVKWSQTTK